MTDSEYPNEKKKGMTMKKFDLSLHVECIKEYRGIVANNANEAEIRAIKDFKSNIYANFNEDEAYACDIKCERI